MGSKKRQWMETERIPHTLAWLQRCCCCRLGARHGRCCCCARARGKTEGRQTEIRCPDWGRARMNSTVPCCLFCPLDQEPMAGWTWTGACYRGHLQCVCYSIFATVHRPQYLLQWHPQCMLQCKIWSIYFRSNGQDSRARYCSSVPCLTDLSPSASRACSTIWTGTV
jgi:hypothetical protein